MRLIFANRLEKRRKYGYFILQWSGPGGGMADAADLKSAFRNEVRVRSPSRVPLNNQWVVIGQPKLLLGGLFPRWDPSNLMIQKKEVAKIGDPLEVVPL